MRNHRWILSALLAAGLLTPAYAGPFSFLRRLRDKEPEPQPQQQTQAAPSNYQHVADLVTMLRTAPGAGRRAAAATSLADYAGSMEVIPALMESAQRDPKPEVRLAAVQSLGRIRPVTADIGRVIEQVVNGDSSMRVRLTARTTLAQYQLAGYRGGNTPPQGPPLPTSTQEPPLADTADVGPALTPPDAPPSPQLFPQPLPRGPVNPPASAPQRNRVAPVPVDRRGAALAEPMQNGVPLSSYRMIAVPPRQESLDSAPTLEPLHHEESAAPEPPPTLRLRRFMVTLPPPPKAVGPVVPEIAPSSTLEPLPTDAGPLLTPPQ